MNDAVTEKLIRVGSEARAEVLAREAAELPAKEAAELLADWFNVCDALAPARFDLRRQFERCEFVGDYAAAPELPVTVYRAAWDDDDAATALSWTTDREVAERFCRGLTGLRAMFLGIWRDDATPTIFEGLCTEAYGYLTSRDEHEVIAKTVVGIRPIAELITEPGHPGVTRPGRAARQPEREQPGATMSHTFHEGPERAVLFDGCDECDRRAADPIEGLLLMDTERFATFTDRMLDIEYDQGCPLYLTENEAAVGRHLYYISLLMQRNPLAFERIRERVAR
jgi:hypothetical protein